MNNIAVPFSVPERTDINLIFQRFSGRNATRPPYTASIQTRLYSVKSLVLCQYRCNSSLHDQPDMAHAPDLPKVMTYDTFHGGADKRRQSFLVSYFVKAVVVGIKWNSLVAWRRHMLLGVPSIYYWHGRWVCSFIDSRRSAWSPSVCYVRDDDDVSRILFLGIEDVAAKW